MILLIILIFSLFNMYQKLLIINTELVNTYNQLQQVESKLKHIDTTYASVIAQHEARMDTLEELQNVQPIIINKEINTYSESDVKSEPIFQEVNKVEPILWIATLLTGIKTVGRTIVGF